MAQHLMVICVYMVDLMMYELLSVVFAFFQYCLFQKQASPSTTDNTQKKRRTTPPLNTERRQTKRKRPNSPPMSLNQNQRPLLQRAISIKNEEEDIMMIPSSSSNHHQTKFDIQPENFVSVKFVKKYKTKQVSLKSFEKEFWKYLERLIRFYIYESSSKAFPQSIMHYVGIIYQKMFELCQIRCRH